VPWRIRRQIREITGGVNPQLVRETLDLGWLAERDRCELHSPTVGRTHLDVDGHAPEAYAPDEVCVGGREVYLHTPNGMGKSRLVPAVMKQLGLAGTTRNWRSTQKLAALAADLG